MRLDLFLKSSRLVKRRGMAKALCEAGKVRVDGLPAKAARQIRAGNRIALDLYRRHVVIEVQEVRRAMGGRSKPEALYTVVSERRTGPGIAEWGEEGNDADIHG